MLSAACVFRAGAGTGRSCAMHRSIKTSARMSVADERGGDAMQETHIDINMCALFTLCSSHTGERSEQKNMINNK